MLVPAETPVTFRGTSTDVDPRLRRRHDQRERDADPRLRRDVHDDVQEDGRAPDAVPRILRHRRTRRCGRASRSCRSTSSCAQARKRRKADLCSSLGSSCSRISGSRSSAFAAAHRAGRVADVRAQPARRAGSSNPEHYYRSVTAHGTVMALRAADARRDGLRLRDHRAFAQASADRACAGRGAASGWWSIGTVMAATTVALGQASVLYTFYPPMIAQRRSTTSASCWSWSARGSGSR